MNIMKIRPVGNSLVITLPHALAEQFPAGTYMNIDTLPSGGLVLTPVERRAAVRELSRQIIEEDAEALTLLAPHDGPVEAHHSRAVGS